MENDYAKNALMQWRMHMHMHMKQDHIFRSSPLQKTMLCNDVVKQYLRHKY